MPLHRLVPGLLAAVVTLGAITASAPLHPHLRRAATAGQARLVAFGSRGGGTGHDAGQPRHDAMLADLYRHVARLRGAPTREDVQALNPAARFASFGPDPTVYVLVDAITRGDPLALRDALVALGLRQPAIYANDVGGWLPVDALARAASLAELHALRAALPHRRAGAVGTAGDYVLRSADLRAASPAATGAGVTVGILSDSYDCYAVYAKPGSGVPASGAAGYASNGYTADAAHDQATGDLPAQVTVLAEANCLSYGAPTQLPFGDEGRAMMQIVHDLAPQAALKFYTAFNSEADFANGIVALADAGATVEMDDIGYFDEPYYQDGLVAQAIDTVTARGVAYFAAAGNNGGTAVEYLPARFPTLSTTAPNAGEHLLTFDATGLNAAPTLSVSIPALAPGDYVAIVLHWDQPYVTGAKNSPGASSNLDLCVTGAGSDVIEDLDGATVSCTGANATGADPVQVMLVGNPANASGNTGAETINVMVGLAGGTTPGRVKVTLEGNGLPVVIQGNGTPAGTLQGHPGAAGALAIGAAFYFDTPRCGTTPARVEDYTAVGGTPLLFDSAGVRLPAPLLRQKPDVVGPDGVNNTFLGYTLASDGVPGGLLTTADAACQNAPAYPNFYGTSAATPHVGAVAALLRGLYPTLTAAQVHAALRSSALPIAAGGPDATSGYGFVQADAALAALAAPPVVTLSLSPVSVPVRGTSTLSWSSGNATDCVGSGAWLGSEPASGSSVLTPTTAGTQTYTLTCTNASGSTAQSVTLTATAAPPAPGSGGGGALDPAALALLAVRVLARGRVRAGRCASR